ncbi:dienelactone hydrolase family protein [Myxococcota bacterium]|nr:dienelactone hydrolase family protein [Myxococcota bacterium]
MSSTTVRKQGLIFTPDAGEKGNRRWPAVVFAHGLCGPTKRYSDTLTRIASWGFVVIANEKQEDCGAIEAAHPLSAMENFFLMPFKFGNAVNFSKMAKNVEKNIDYALTRKDVDPKKIALMGHSMGGGIVVDVAAHLAEKRPGLVKAVIGIAPWNGVRPRPSNVAHEVKAPILIFCSMSDLLCPCSGEVKITDTQGLITGRASVGFPLLFGPDANSTWHGGSLAIFEDSQTATLIEVDAVSHFTIMGVDRGTQMQDLADWANQTSGLNFNHPDRPYRNIPTVEYAVAFLNQTLKLDQSRGEQSLRQASADPRIVNVKRAE